MNIALFSPNQNPYSETFIQAHKEYLKGTVFYYYGNHPISLENEGSLEASPSIKFQKIIQKLKKKPRSWIQEKALGASLKKQGIQVALVEYGTHAAALYQTLKKYHIPMVVHFHGYDASVASVIQKNNGYQEVFAYASKVVAVSKRMEAKLLELGCAREKLIYNVYGPRPEFAQVNPNFQHPQFLAVGRFTDKKAPYFTILAFHKIAKKFPEAKLLMAGDGALLPTCNNLVRYLGLETQVRFLGVIDAPHYRRLLESSLALVQHSLTAANGDQEGTPLAILEASSAGLPVIATDHAGIPDVIVHQETGLLLAEHDVDAMARHMENLLADLDYAKQLGKQGKARIQQHFTLSRHIEVLNELLANAAS